MLNVNEYERLEAIAHKGYDKAEKPLNNEEK
jgi:hypothetical protein